MKVTLKSIAQELNVSTNSVSLALRGKGGLCEQTRNTIVEKAREMGYFDQKPAKSSKSVCLVATNENLLDSYFYMYIQNRIQQMLQEKGIAVHVHSTNAKATAASFSQYIEANNIQGVILLGDIDADYAAMIVACKVPVVSLGAYYYNLPIPSVVEDNIAGSFLAVKHLLDKGYQNIGFIGCIKDCLGFFERYMGYLGALKHFSLPAHDEWILTDMAVGNKYNPSVYAELLSQLEVFPDAFLCANDNIAFALIKALHGLGFDENDRTAIIGFDNSEVGHMAVPSLTSIEVFRQQQAIEVVNLLFAHMQSQPIPSRLIIPVKLVEHESVPGRRPSGDSV